MAPPMMKPPRMRNPGTRLGRPPTPKMPAKGAKSSIGEPMAPGPMDGLDTAMPGAAFKRGGSVMGCSPMPYHHDDPKMCKGGRMK